MGLFSFFTNLNSVGRRKSASIITMKPNKKTRKPSSRDGICFDLLNTSEIFDIVKAQEKVGWVGFRTNVGFRLVV